MKKYLLSLLIFTSFITHSYSQAIGEWRAHLAYHNATFSIPVDNMIYVLSDHSLYSYDTEDTSIKTYDKVNYLSDTEISHIAYSKPHKTLIIVYKSSNIDLLINDEETYNISDFMNKSMTEDKTLNNISINGEYAYLSTNFGIVIVNLKKREITNSYNLGKKVYNSFLLENTIYAATDKGIYTGNTSDNLLDNSNWNLINSSEYHDLLLYNNTIIGKRNNEGLYKYNKENDSFDLLRNGSYTYMNVYNENLIAGNNNTVVIFNSIDSSNNIYQEEGFQHVSLGKSNTYWSSNGDKGLNGYKYNEDKKQFEKTVESIIPNSPRRNYFHYMTITNGRLLVAGGSLNYAGVVREGTLMMYEDGEWSSFQEEGIVEKTGVVYLDLTSIIQDPLDPNHHFATSAAQGLYEFKNKEFVELYSLHNSKLESAVPKSSNPQNYVRLNGLQYDKDNNLWMVNSETPQIIKVLKKNGEWIIFNHPDIAGSSAFERILFDRNGRVWATAMWYKNSGVFCFDIGNTLENTSDDKTMFRTTFPNQDGKTINPTGVYSIAEDKNGVIWVGTEQGPLLFNNPASFLTNDFYCTQVKIPRNDGTNNADLLLENERINSICIDGANRKWIGTQNSGVYLLSEDGIETIHHFTKDNSPLLSNEIESIVIDPKSGEVYIGTNKGLVTYRSDAIEAEDTFSEDAYAFPNPVYPEYEGVITVTGLVRDSDVKITDSTGNLIYTGTSVGGQFTWNGKNRNGKRVASGVYFVLAANSEGKEGIVTKILMIK